MTRIDHGAVLGGGMAGILAARVLANRCDRVTVVDRDRFPEAGMHRSGIPQDRHIHALQARGARTIERLFPGATDELARKGAVIGEWGRDSTMCFDGNRLRSVDAGLELLAASRPLLESHLRDRLGHLPNVTFRDDCVVRGLVLDDTGSSVAAVRLLPREDRSAEELLAADLVVDATGRGSRLPQWLEAIGYPSPRAEETGLEVAYTSCRFPRSPDDDKHVIIAAAVPPGRRGGGAIAIENDSWVVTLGGVLGEQAPTDPGAFMEYAATLAIPDIHELIRDRQPLSEPVLMRYSTGRRRRYDHLDRLPEGLVVMGDALCSFNPVYGQGMTVAAAEALALDACLNVGTHQIASRFLAAIADVVDDAWEMAANGDARYVPSEAGPPSLPRRLIGRYQRRLLAAAVHDPEVSRAFKEVMAMVARPPALLRPRVAGRVLTARWRRGTIAEEQHLRTLQEPRTGVGR